MSIYITEINRENERFEGPQISALSWKEAETLAHQQGVILVGELAD